MKFFRYIGYFFFIGINWGWKLAVILLRQEISGEKKYGIDTTGADELKKLKRSGTDISHSTIYMPVSYPVFEKTLNQLDSSAKKHFLDIGCGKGRAMCIAAHYGFNFLTGIDFSEKFCQAASENLGVTKEKLPAINFNVITEDAATATIPPDTDCIFLFNPFDEVIMKKVVNNILKSLLSFPRQLQVIYANPLHKNLFIENKFEETYYSKHLRYFEVCILSYWHQ